MGYHIPWIAPPGKDRRIDIIAYSDPLGATPPRLKVQVKREKAAIDVSTVKSFIGSIGGNDLGLFVTTGLYTKDARDAARVHDGHQITLLNREGFFELWVSHFLKLSDDARELLTITAVHFLRPTK